MAWEAIPQGGLKRINGKFYTNISGSWEQISKGGLKRINGKYYTLYDSKPQQPEVEQPEVVTEPEVTGAELIAGSAPGRVVLGAGRLLSGPFQLGANIGDYIAEQMGSEPIVGEWANQKLSQLDEMKKRGMAAQRFELPYSPNTVDISGEGIGVLDMLGGFGGDGFDVLGLLGEFGSGVAAVPKMKLAKTLLGKLKQGGLLGMGFGAASPVDYAEDDFGGKKFSQIQAGGLYGMGLPLGLIGGSKLIGFGKNIIDPLLKGGAERLGNKTIREAAGEKTNDIIELLKQNKQLPGGRATAGEVAAPAGSAEFSALQNIANKNIPSEKYAANEAENLARLNALATVGKDEGAIALARKARGENWEKSSKKAYKMAVGAAFNKQGKPIKSMTSEDLVDIFKNPFIKPAINDAVKLAKAKNINPNLEPTQYLQYVKISLDKQLAKTGSDSLGKAERAAVESLRKKLINWMGEKNPSYDKMRTQFAEESIPINQMQIGQYLIDKLSPALADYGANPLQRSGVFAQALRDAPGTLKKSTGFNRYEKLTDVLTKPQMRAVSDVAESLGRQATYKNLAQEGNQRVAGLLGLNEKLLPSTGPLDREYMIFKTILNRIQGKISQQSLDYISKILLDPSKTVNILENVSKKDLPIVKKALQEAFDQSLMKSPIMFSQNVGE